MSRPDWGALQQEYIAEYTRSGISPVAWCEARGLNYATARRYIKKTPKNAQKEMRKTAQKSARKKTAQTAQRQNGKSQKKKAVSDALLIEGDTEEISFCPDEFGISDQQAKFAMLVAQGKKPTEAYRLAGYEGQGATANSNASRMLRNARVYRAISYFRNQYQKRYTADLDLLVSQLMAIVQADPNQLAQFRRVNCRYCWGENHLYQWRDIAEFDKAAAQASRDGKPEPEEYFRMSPEDWLSAEMQGEIVALVHSHPGGLPWLSEADRRLQVQSDLPWWLVCRGAIHKFRCVPHLTGRRFEHGVTDCYTLFRDAYHLAGIEMPDFHRGDDWWRNGQNLYLDNLEATGLYQVPLSAAQPGDVLLCCFGSSVPNHAAIYCGDSELLHHIPEQLSKRERYTDKWQRRTHSLWRHRAWHASAFTGIYNDLAAASTFE